MPAINVILDEINELGNEDQEYVFNIIKNRLRDKKRADHAARAREAMKNAETGAIKTGGFQELWIDLND